MKYFVEFIINTAPSVFRWQYWNALQCHKNKELEEILHNHTSSKNNSTIVDIFKHWKCETAEKIKYKHNNAKASQYYQKKLCQTVFKAWNLYR